MAQSGLLAAQCQCGKGRAACGSAPCPLPRVKGLPAHHGIRAEPVQGNHGISGPTQSQTGLSAAS